MRVLYIDDDRLSLNITKSILEQRCKKSFFIDGVCCKMEDGWKRYIEGGFDFVMIDLSIPKSYAYELIDKITYLNPFQKIITLSNGAGNLNRPSSKLGCIHCKENHKRIRISKPLNVKILRDTLINFENKNCCFSFN